MKNCNRLSRFQRAGFWLQRCTQVGNWQIHFNSKQIFTTAGESWRLLFWWRHQGGLWRRGSAHLNDSSLTLCRGRGFYRRWCWYTVDLMRLVATKCRRHSQVYTCTLWYYTKIWVLNNGTDLQIMYYWVCRGRNRRFCSRWCWHDVLNCWTIGQ